ncbi:MAG: hypothetical protein WBA97_08005 [Actinophytocola sp.]|uniref:hypothetical protein n=1 Tax=Actinophytocola sp. TaxID=1872138 RepID=UPI003C794974
MADLDGREIPRDPELCTHCENPPDPADVPAQQDRGALLDLVFRVSRGEHVGELPAELDELVGSVPVRRDGAKADAVVLYSGGKDSSWMLHDLAARDVRVVAWMLDQGYQSPLAIRNAQALCDRLDVELVIARPERDPMNTLFRLGFAMNEEDDTALLRAAMSWGSACWPCFSTILAQASVYCRDNAIPLCFVGTHKGQNRTTAGDSPIVKVDGLTPLDGVVEEQVSLLRKHAERKAPEAAELLRTGYSGTALVPFYEFVPKPSTEQIIADLEEIGWEVPRNTGTCSTNCMINELGYRIMRNQYGFDIYQIAEAHERRLSPNPTPANIAILDEEAIRRGAKLIDLTPVESQRWGIER